MAGCWKLVKCFQNFARPEKVSRLTTSGHPTFGNLRNRFQKVHGAAPRRRSGSNFWRFGAVLRTVARGEFRGCVGQFRGGPGWDAREGFPKVPERRGGVPSSGGEKGSDVAIRQTPSSGA